MQVHLGCCCCCGCLAGAASAWRLWERAELEVDGVAERVARRRLDAACRAGRAVRVRCEAADGLGPRRRGCDKTLLADECLGPCGHVGQVVWHEKELDCSQVGVLDHELNLALGWDTVAWKCWWEVWIWSRRRAEVEFIQLVSEGLVKVVGFEVDGADVRRADGGGGVSLGRARRGLEVVEMSWELEVEVRWAAERRVALAEAEYTELCIECERL